MIENILDQSADLISASLTMSQVRYEVVDYLTPIGMETYSIFIKVGRGIRYNITLLTKSPAFESLYWCTFFGISTESAIFCYLKITEPPRRQMDENKSYTNTLHLFRASQRVPNTSTLLNECILFVTFPSQLWLPYSSYKAYSCNNPKRLTLLYHMCCKKQGQTNQFIF